MEIQFEKKGSVWVAEFQVTSDFNLHLERDGIGLLKVMQRTTPDGSYDHIKGGLFTFNDRVLDVDFTAVIYPKWIQVTSISEPTKCVVTNAQ